MIYFHLEVFTVCETYSMSIRSHLLHKGSVKARSHDPILGSEIGSRRSDCPISRFRFCGENVGRLFVVCSHDQIFRTDKEPSIWHQNDHRDIMQNFSAPFIFQEECRMKIEYVLFPSVFFKLTDPCVGRLSSMCSHDPIFGTNKNRILKNGSCERALGKSSRNTFFALLNLKRKINIEGQLVYCFSHVGDSRCYTA